MKELIVGKLQIAAVVRSLSALVQDLLQFSDSRVQRADLSTFIRLGATGIVRVTNGYNSLKSDIFLNK